VLYRISFLRERDWSAKTQMPTLLVVEDDVMIRDMVSRRLLQEGYQVLTAVNGAAAIIRARSERPDLILMDMALPLINGFQATERLKALPDTARIPIIALTAFSTTSDRAECLAAGCDEYESKPIVFVRLFKKIEAFLGHKAGDVRKHSVLTTPDGRQRAS
jgi:CheY-like chemotaxis protein